MKHVSGVDVVKRLLGVFYDFLYGDLKQVNTNRGLYIHGQGSRFNSSCKSTFSMSSMAMNDTVPLNKWFLGFYVENSGTKRMGRKDKKDIDRTAVPKPD